MAQETVSELADKYIIHRLTVSSTARSRGEFPTNLIFKLCLLFFFSNVKNSIIEG
jgi:hypothetical protein